MQAGALNLVHGLEARDGDVVAGTGCGALSSDARVPLLPLEGDEIKTDELELDARRNKREKDEAPSELSVRRARRRHQKLIRGHMQGTSRK